MDMREEIQTWVWFIQGLEWGGGFDRFRKSDNFWTIPRRKRHIVTILKHID